MRRVGTWVWESQSPVARAARGGLTPAAWGLDLAVAGRLSAYRAGWLRSRPLPLPSVSVGNLSVGGTGKTPVASWIAAHFHQRGAKPGILLRGHGGDEGLVHRSLLPAAVVVEDSDRHRGAATAAAAGAEVLVLDDAFQRLDVRRDLDLVLVAAEQGVPPQRTFPAGPWRERWGALGRAGAVVITRKAASFREVETIERRVRATVGPQARVAVAQLSVTGFVGLISGRSRAPVSLEGAVALAATGIGAPLSFHSQLSALGMTVQHATFPDHFAFDAAAVAALVAAGRRTDVIIVTLKDAVKLARLWPADVAEPLVAQQTLTWDSGRDDIASALDHIIQPLRGGESRQTP